MRRLLPALLVALAPGLAAAHHGWSWTVGENRQLAGVVREADLGMPHGVLMIEVQGELWQVEVGQPWRNERAGLQDGDLAPGVELRIEGEPAADAAERRLKAERLWIGDRVYELYPERD